MSPAADGAPSVLLHLGDCRDVLAELPPASVDAVVTDPPYNLSDGGKRDTYCLSRVTAEVRLPHDDDRHAEKRERGELAGPSGGGAPLRWELGTVWVGAGIGMPEGAVHLKCAAVAQHEIDGGNVATSGATDSNLPLVSNSERVEHFGNFTLKPADRGDAPFCYGTCSCFTEPSPGQIAVLVALPRATASDLTGDLLGTRGRGDTNVGAGYLAGGQPERAAEVVALPGAVVHAVLRLDLSRRTGELHLTDLAQGLRPIFHLARAKPIGAVTRAGGLSPVAESCNAGEVPGGANRALALDFPWHALIVTGKAQGFMGKAWDGWESPAAYQRWCVEWASECRRVLKPGGHLLAFGGTRTYHRMAAAVEDAGFEVRDSIHWIYGSGFPKSLDVSKAIDKAAGAEREVVGSKLGQPGYSLAESKRTGHLKFGGFGGDGTPERECAITAPATPEAARWTGWGTALKPAHEPILVARKPLAAGTVAANVLEHGTGAINVDGCRVGTDGGTKGSGPGPRGDVYDPRPGSPEAVLNGSFGTPVPGLGRWPANVVLTHDPDCADTCADGCPVAELDRQSGVRTSGSRNAGDYGLMGYMGAGVAPMPAVVGDSGGASRFFPVFRYCAKAPTRQRPVGADGTKHPTVKPLDLMRWLVRLITPPGGTVLDPFAGSGTTLQAARDEGFHAIGVETEPRYCRLAELRLGSGLVTVTEEIA